MLFGDGDMSKVVVYTVVMGHYDTLHPTRWPGICLTDGLAPVRGWRIRKVQRRVTDPRRASRHPKILSHIYFPDAEYTIYLDGNLRLICDPKVVISLLRGKDMALFPHPQRKCVYAEARKCVEHRKANRAVIAAQMKYYREKGLPSNSGLAACWMIVRRNTAKVKEFNEQWWEEYCRFSCRDQLSFEFVRWRLGIQYSKIPGNVRKGRYFRIARHVRGKRSGKLGRGKGGYARGRKRMREAARRRKRA